MLRKKWNIKSGIIFLIVVIFVTLPKLENLDE